MLVKAIKQIQKYITLYKLMSEIRMKCFTLMNINKNNKRS